MRLGTMHCCAYLTQISASLVNYCIVSYTLSASVLWTQTRTAKFMLNVTLYTYIMTVFSYIKFIKLYLALHIKSVLLIGSAELNHNTFCVLQKKNLCRSTQYMVYFDNWKFSVSSLSTVWTMVMAQMHWNTLP